MINKSQQIYVKFIVHLLCCTMIVYFFGTNCRMRPAAYPALYKEYITGLIAIVTIYFNYFFLFPKLFLRRKHIAYWLYTICSVVLSGCVEMLLVSPQLVEAYSLRNCEIQMITEFLIMDTLCVSVRNLGLVLFSYTINEIFWLKKQAVEKDTAVRKQYDSLDVKDENHLTYLVHTGNIYYCEQDRNISVIHLLDGKYYIRYCSLNSLAELLGETDFVRISRNIIVPKSIVSRFKENKIQLKRNDNYDQPVVFNVNVAYLEKVMSQLNLEMVTTPVQTEKKDKDSSDTEKESSVQNIPSPLEELNHNPKLLTVYHYISTHTQCKIGDISKDCKISKGSVCRYLAKLTELGLISYNGAKKTGGYRVVNQKFSATGNETLRNPSDSENPTVLPA